jgi:Carboxypeptidase regulatory-like domain
MYRKLLFLAGMLAILLLAVAPVHAQNATLSASLAGTVTDPAGAAINGAKVTLTSPERGTSWTYATQGVGLYSFTLLPPATYTLVVEASGFKRYTQAGITLAAGQVAEQNVQLTVGAVTQNIEVTSQAPLLNVDNANISSDVSAKQTEDLPLNFRSVISLAELNSSVSNTAEEQAVGAPGLAQTADQDISFLNFGGTFFNTAAYLVDGTWDTRADWGGVIYTPSVDDVQEFKIQTNAFTAQYGWSSGNVVNIVTKSGTNEIHGDAYEFYANSAFDARNYFNNGAQPSFDRHQFGGTIGGPIKKDKLYFFAYYEGLRQSSPETAVFTMPPSAFRTGDFSALLGAQVGTDYLGRPIYSGELYNPFSTRQVTCGATDPVTGNPVTCPAGAATEYIRDPMTGNIATGLGVTNMIPATMMDSLASKIATGNYWPTPLTGALTNNYTATAAAPEHSNEYSGRLDYNYSDNDRLYARWSQKYQTKTNTPTFYGASDIAGPGLVNPNNRYSINGGWSHIFGPTLAMTANLGVNRHVEGGTTQSLGFKDSSLGLPSWLDANSPAFPEFTEGIYAHLGATGGNDNYITPQTLWTESLDLTKAAGRHAFAFGFMDVWLRIDGGHWADTTLNFATADTGGPDPLNETSGTGDGFASFLIGVGSGGSGHNQFPATDKHFLGWYLQDDWKVTPKFTFNLGLRYEIQTAPVERYNAQEYFDFTAVNPISGVVTGLTGLPASFPGEVVYNSNSNRGLYRTPHDNLAPRIGAAYQAAYKLVLRGGYGIFFVPNYMGQGPNDGYSQPTSWINTLNNGLNPASTLSGNANVTCLTPTPAACPAVFYQGQLLPSGNSEGSLTDVGFGATATQPLRHTPYVQQWMAGIQYSLTTNDLVDISYVGNSGTNVLAQGLQWNEFPAADLSMGAALNNEVPNPFFGAINASSCGLNDPTVQLNQLLKPYPEFCSVYENEPAVGKSTYNALQATYTHRWHSGLNMVVSYTFSKFLDNVQGSSGWAFPGSGSNVRNSYNLDAEKSVDVSDTPHSLVVNYNYELPFGRRKQFGANWSAVEDAILGGWQWTGILTAKSGLPLSINPISGIGYGFNQRPNVVPGVDPIPANQSINNWINPAAFSQPAPFTFGDAPRFFSNIRAPRYFDWDMGILKSWHFTEHKQFEFRFEMFNALNHPDFFEPDTNLGDSTFGQIHAAYQERTAQLAGKFYF